MREPYNVGVGGYWGRLARLWLAAINHPAGVATRHVCRQILKRRLMRPFKRMFREQV